MHTKEQLTTVCTMPCASSQQHTLPKRDNMHSISEVLIPNNDQHQLNKTATTNNRINSKIKQQHTTFVNWCYCLRKVLFQKMFVRCSQVYLAWTTIPLPNRQGEQTETASIIAGPVCVEDEHEDETAPRTEDYFMTLKRTIS